MALSLRVRVGRRLQELREKRGLNQTQLSDMAGINRSHLSQIENGAAAPRLDTIDDIAKALGITLEQLFKGF